MPYSEEDIKQKFVLPYLQSIGFELNELTLEKGFRIRFPNRTFRVDTAKEITSAGARLDILVTRNGKNLFIVEAKIDSQELTDGDRDQAITYCRLVDPMAPFAIVTNGRTTKMYRSLDKEEVGIKKDAIIKYDPGKDLQDLYSEALEHFIGYSPENFLTFCGSQIDQAMTTLMGSSEEPHKKFIPEVFVSSRRLSSEIARFLESDKAVFAIIGESGIGKTCAMCGLSGVFRRTHPVLFYRARNFITDIPDTIASDFNWAFSPQSSAITLFKKLDRLLTDKPLLVFVDAVDEWENQLKVEILGDFARHIKGRNIRLILSCRGEPWPQFLNSRGIPSDLSTHIFAAEEGKPGFQLAPIDPGEFTQLLRQYRKFYGFTGPIDAEVVKECRQSPFLLRICFEVAKQHKAPRLSLTIREIFDEYFDRILERVSARDVNAARRVLLILARLQLEKNQEVTSESVLRSTLGLRFDEEIPQALFDASILEKNPLGSEFHVGFYFRKLRDYLVAFHVERWDKQNTDDFRQSWRETFWSGVRLQAALLFYQLANVEKKKVIDGPYRASAEAYLDLYDSILQQHFPNLRKRFLPHTAGAIGFVAVLDLLGGRVVAYGFTVNEPGEERVKFVPSLGNIWGKREADLPFLYETPALQYRSSTDGFNNIDVRQEVVENEILDQIRALVRVGALNEFCCYYLSLEKVLGLIFVLQKDCYGLRNIHAISQCLPIQINQIELQIRYSRAYRELEHRARQQKLAKGNDPLTFEDIQHIQQQARDIATNSAPLPSTIRNIPLDTAELMLEEALAALRVSANAVDDVILPDQDNFSGSLRCVWDYWTEETLAAWIPRFYEMFISDYKHIVEQNFPTLKHYFELYSQMPGAFFVVVHPGTNPLKFEVYTCASNGAEVNSVIRCQPSDIQYFSTTRVLAWKGQQFMVRGIWYASVESIMCSPNYHLLGAPREFVFLRQQVYTRIQRELPIVCDALRQMI